MGAGAQAGAIDSMQRLVQLGRWPFFAIVTGAVACGVYQFICARNRRIAAR
jgi:hypothetical protein